VFFWAQTTQYVGKFGDEMHLSIIHSPFIAREPPVSEKFSVEQLRWTLPPNWKVFQTYEGRYLFCEGSTGRTFWNHPNPVINWKLNELNTDESIYSDYEALSYVWGSPMQRLETVHVEANDRSANCIQTGRTLQIRLNLWQALQHLRFQSRPRVLWVDALCINQDDIQERNKQVKRMSDIYKASKTVLVWLGPEENNSKLALATLSYLGQQIECITEGPIGRSPNAQEPHWYRTTTSLPYDNEIWTAITHLFRRLWFSRVWILQEIQLANKHAMVLVGNNEISWHHLRRAILGLDHRKNAPRELGECLKNALFIARNTASLCIEPLLQHVKRLECKDPRDRIYGLLGIFPRYFARKTQPQYSISVLDLYRDFFITISEKTLRLDLLQMCGLESYNPDWPSWVPDWTRSGRFNIQMMAHAAAGLSRANIVQLNPDILKVTGVHCATILEVKQPSSGSLSQQFDIVRSWEPDNLQSGRYVTGESLLETHLRMLRFNRFTDRYPGSAYCSLHEWYCDFTSHVQKSVSRDEAEIPELLEIDHLHNTSYITTNEGFIGLAPATALPGKYSSANAG